MKSSIFPLLLLPLVICWNRDFIHEDNQIGRRDLKQRTNFRTKRKLKKFHYLEEHSKDDL